MASSLVFHPRAKESRKPARTPVQRGENLNDGVYRILKDDILACELRPGEEISEGVLVARYGFSKAPIRSALTRLRQESLVVSRGRLGNMVAPITVQDVHEIYHLRVILEVEAARLAAGKVDRERLRTLEQAVRVSLASDDAPTRQDYREANRQLHRYIARASGNERLAAMVIGLIEQHERIVHFALSLQNRDREFHHEHDALVAALIEGDADRAARLTERAVRGSQDKIMESLLSMAGPVPLRRDTPPAG